MAKDTIVKARLSDDEVRRLKTLQGDKTISDCIRNLINERFTENKKELQGIEDLLKKLDSAETVKIAKDIKRNFLQSIKVSVLINELSKITLSKEQYQKFKGDVNKIFDKFKGRKEDL